MRSCPRCRRARSARRSRCGPRVRHTRRSARSSPSTARRQAQRSQRPELAQEPAAHRLVDLHLLQAACARAHTDQDAPGDRGRRDVTEHVAPERADLPRLPLLTHGGPRPSHAEQRRDGRAGRGPGGAGGTSTAQWRSPGYSSTTAKRNGSWRTLRPRSTPRSAPSHRPWTSQGPPTGWPNSAGVRDPSMREGRATRSGRADGLVQPQEDWDDLAIADQLGTCARSSTA